MNVYCIETLFKVSWETFKHHKTKYLLCKSAECIDSDPQ